LISPDNATNAEQTEGGGARIISRLVIILFPLLPHRKDGHGLRIFDLKQGGIACAARRAA
jgi:hypothetical protein